MKRLSMVVIENLQSKEMVEVRNTLDFLQRVMSLFVPKSGCAEMILPFLEYLMMVCLCGGSSSV